MSLESARAVRHRRIAERERLEVKRLAYIDVLAGKDDEERARLMEMTVGQIIAERYRLDPTLPLKSTGSGAGGTP